MSWWSRRRRRGCLVPAVPRVCSMGRRHGQEEEMESIITSTSTACSHNINTNFNTSRLVGNLIVQYRCQIIHNFSRFQTISPQKSNGMNGVSHRAFVEYILARMQDCKDVTNVVLHPMYKEAIVHLS